MQVRTFTIFIFLISFNCVAGAFQLSPIELDLEPEGRASQSTFTLENQGGNPAAIQFKVYVRGTDREGNETRQPTDQILILPAQLKLDAGEKRKVQVIWKGPKQLDAERAYRVVAEQLPINFEARKAKNSGLSLEFLLKFVASVYVAPPGPPGAAASAEAVNSPLEVQSLHLNRKANELEFLLVNKGGKHRILTGLKLYTGESTAAKLVGGTARAYDGFAGKNLLAHAQKKFIIKVPPDITTAPSRVFLRFE